MRCLVTAHDTQEGGPVPPARPSTQAEKPLASAILQEALMIIHYREGQNIIIRGGNPTAFWKVLVILFSILFVPLLMISVGQFEITIAFIKAFNPTMVTKANRPALAGGVPPNAAYSLCRRDDRKTDIVCDASVRSVVRRGHALRALSARLESASLLGCQIQRPSMRRARGREGGGLLRTFIALAINPPTLSAVAAAAPRGRPGRTRPRLD